MQLDKNVTYILNHSDNAYLKVSFENSDMASKDDDAAAKVKRQAIGKIEIKMKDTGEKK